MLFLLPAAGDGLLHPGSLLCFLFLIANVVHEDQFLAVFAQDILIQELFSLTREHFSIISCLPDNMESINSFMVQPEFERTLRADQIFDPGQRNDCLHLLPFPIKESDAEFIDLLCKLPQRVACHPKERTVGIEAQDLVDRVILCRGHICKLLCAIRMGDHAHGLVHLLHTARHLASLRVRSVVLVVLVVVVLGIIGLFRLVRLVRLVRLLRLGGRPPVVAVVLLLVPVGVVAGQTAARYLVVVVGEGVIGDLADISAADGRSFAAGAGARLGLHLGVAEDDDVIGVVGVAGRRIRVYLAAFRACAVADASRAGAGGMQIFIRIAACGRHLAAGNFDVAALAVHTAADTGSALAAHGLYRAAGDLDVAAGALHSSADACATFVAALGGEGAVLALVVLDGQGALWLVAVLLEARIVAAALQLVFAIQLDGRIAIALDPDSSFALIAGVDLQVVEGDVHVALGGVDGDGVLLRLAGDDGVGVLHILLALCDPVRAFGVARLHGDVAVGDVPLGRVGRDAGAYHNARDDGGGYAPPECAFQSHSTSPFVLCIMQCRRCGSGAPLRG